MTNVSERIKSILTHYGINSGEFATKLNIQKSSVSHLLSGRNRPSFVFLSKFVRVFPEIDIRWLLTGEGDMLINSIDKTVADKPNDIEVQIKQKKETPLQNVLSSDNATDVQIKSIIVIYDDDKFKILEKINR